MSAIDLIIRFWFGVLIGGILLSLIARMWGHGGFFPRLCMWLIIVPVFTVCAFWDGLFFFTLLMVCCGIGCGELFKLTAGRRQFIYFIPLLLVSLVWVVWAYMEYWFPWSLTPLITIIPASVMLTLRGSANSPWPVLFLSMSVGFSLSYWVLLENLEHGYRFVIYCFSITVMNDIMSYSFGKFLGGYKPFPRLSPKKTIVGYLGGMISSMVISYVLWPLVAEFNYAQTILAGLLIAVSGSFGDLVASGLKRHYGVKDYSRLLGRMGGMLDRLDSLIGSGWVFFFYLQLLI